MKESFVRLVRVSLELKEERERSGRYFERMKRNEGNLAEIRARLGVSNKPNRHTMNRIYDLLETEREYDKLRDVLHEIGWRCDE